MNKTELEDAAGFVDDYKKKSAAIEKLENNLEDIVKQIEPYARKVLKRRLELNTKYDDIEKAVKQRCFSSMKISSGYTYGFAVEFSEYIDNFETYDCFPLKDVYDWSWEAEMMAAAEQAAQRKAVKLKEEEDKDYQYYLKLKEKYESNI